FSGLIFFFIGGAPGLLLPLPGGLPHGGIPIIGRWFPPRWGGEMAPAFYTKGFCSAASVVMFFFFLPRLLGAFGNFLTPLMIGAKDMAFPKLNMCSYWFMWPGFVIIVSSFFVEGGAAGNGWTSYPTISSAAMPVGGGFESPASPTSGHGQILWLCALLCVGV